MSSRSMAASPALSRETSRSISTTTATLPPATPMAAMPFVQGDYIAGDYTPEKLARREGVFRIIGWR